jgi:hypothetical protein
MPRSSFLDNKSQLIKITAICQELKKISYFCYRPTVYRGDQKVYARLFLLWSEQQEETQLYTIIVCQA